MLPTDDIIPITYMGGTGGNFLCHFIVSAKRNIKDVIPLSEHGNAHEFSMKDIDSSPKGINSPDKDKVDFLLSRTPLMTNTEKPYYVPCHIRDINTTNQNFKKSIRIVYDNDDIAEITNILYGKWVLDCIDKKASIHRKETYAYGIHKFHIDFVEIKDMPNVLFISWKEYFKGNIDDFINKLSTFTNISIENFSKESLLNWRQKTQECIDKFSD